MYSEAEAQLKLKSRERKYAVKEMPSFLDYFGYLYFCGGSIAGPFYEYGDYLRYIKLEEEYKSIPSTVLPALQRFVTAFFFIGTGAVLGNYFDDEYILNESFGNQAFLFKVLYLFMYLKARMHTYYAAFVLMESACISSGFSYNG